MKTIYIAKDENHFVNKYECEDYEWMLDHPAIEDVKFYNGDGKELKEIFSEQTYANTEKIIVLNNMAVDALIELGDYTGNLSYIDVQEPGVWKWDNTDEVFVKIGKI